MSTDEQLAQALRTADNTYLALYDDTERPPPDDVRPLYDALRMARDSSKFARQIPALTHPVLPIPSLRRVARGIAPISFPTSADGVMDVRSLGK